MHGAGFSMRLHCVRGKPLPFMGMQAQAAPQEGGGS